MYPIISYENQIIIRVHTPSKYMFGGSRRYRKSTEFFMFGQSIDLHYLTCVLFDMRAIWSWGNGPPLSYKLVFFFQSFDSKWWLNWDTCTLKWWKIILFSWSMVQIPNQTPFLYTKKKTDIYIGKKPCMMHARCQQSLWHVKNITGIILFCYFQLITSCDLTAEPGVLSRRANFK